MLMPKKLKSKDKKKILYGILKNRFYYYFTELPFVLSQTTPLSGKFKVQIF